MKKTALLLSEATLLILALFSVANGGTLYLVNNGKARLDVYDPVLQRKTGSIATAGGPVKAALSPNKRLLAITQGENLSEWPDAVRVFDVPKGNVVATVGIVLTRYRDRGDAFPVFSKDSKKLYTAESGTGFLNVIDASSWKLVKKLALCTNPLNPVLSADGKRLYVPCLYSGNVAVVDAENDLVLDTIKIDGQPSAVAIDLTGKVIYVADRLNNNVWAMNVKTGGVAKKYAVGSAPSNLMLVNAFLYVLNTHSNTLSVIDVERGEDVRSMGIAILPSKMAFDQESKMLYVVSEDASISVVDTANNERLKNIPIDSIPTDMVFVP
ncbi:MAG: YncE family protein [Deltaproteobacteria bacterium]|nr:YncE family protein [Deltaproteobacteria bacterium]